MLYTILGKTGLRVSRLGFGGMRFPMAQDGRIDRDIAYPLLEKAFALGINYFDTAVGYCNGDSQRVYGEVFHYRRDKVVLSTKNPAHESSTEDWWKCLEDSLALLRTGHIDIYNFHGISWDLFTRCLEGPSGKLRFMEKARDQGMIRHICCSVHDTPEGIIKLMETGVFQSFTLQYNLLYRELEPVLERAHSLNLGIVVMGPVGGGRLGLASERIRQLTGNRVESTPEAALRFVLAKPAVHVALSGMSSIAMVEENCRIVSERPAFTHGELQSIESEIQRVKQSAGVYCTACGYCLPCPFGVDIPENFKIYNNHLIYGLNDQDLAAYRNTVNRAGECTECGACLPKCPQKIPIPAMLRKAMAALDPDVGPLAATLSIDRALSSNSLQIRLILKNMCHKPVRPTMALDLKNNATADLLKTAIGTLDPQGTAILSFPITIPDGVGCLEGHIHLTFESQRLSIPVLQPFMLIPTNTPRRHRAVIRPTDFPGNDELVDKVGYDLLLHHDAHHLYAEFQIHAPLQGLAKAPRPSGTLMEMFLDMRPAVRLGTPSYENGVEQFFMFFSEDGYTSKSGRRYTIKHRFIPSPDGGSLKIEVPFRDFIENEPMLPQSIGLDCMFAYCTPQGHYLGHPTYGLRQGLWQNPRLFNRAFLC